MDLEQLKEFATERQRQIINAVIKHGSQGKAAKYLGINSRSLERSLQSAKRQAAKRGWSPDHDMNHPVPDGFQAKGISTYYDLQTGEPLRQWVKSDLKKEDQTEALKAFAEGLIQELPKYKPLGIKPARKLSDRLVAYVIGDAHIGMSTTNAENRNEGDWNLETAERVTLGAIRSLITASGGGDVGLLLNLGDMIHADNSNGTTTAGTQLSTDGTYGDSIAAAVRVLRSAIDMMLATHNSVVVINNTGNHDHNSAIAINTMLIMFYELEPRVTVKRNEHKLTSYVYGQNLLCTHHGDKIQIQRAYEYITRTMPDVWGATRHRHLLLGHLHTSITKELGGLLVEHFQALPASDKWHSNEMYGSKRTMSAIVYDKEHGEIQRHKVGIGQLEDAA
tara:strand:- start:936 stop:2111 length:1176 start_codon:yes stop_codon:yes gene_type:complete